MGGGWLVQGPPPLNRRMPDANAVAPDPFSAAPCRRGSPTADVGPGPPGSTGRSSLLLLASSGPDEARLAAEKLRALYAAKANGRDRVEVNTPAG